jgi:hypothetical protein
MFRICHWLGGLDLLGWRRKRKNAAAISRLKTLIEYRKDRLAAVFLFAQVSSQMCAYGIKRTCQHFRSMFAF